ncbi:outer membrane beta-barrel protein [Winogradskyella sp.]|uniref:outer membrane beta-barrel protein n=1 Tax=Winogradskyella sp. TaxID=1883156 RepID=UPI00262F8B89|nr:outer membrane beta-barrel protein [Winogradskyella sp.]
MKLPVLFILLIFTTFTFSQENDERFNLEKGSFIFEGDFSVNTQNNELSLEGSQDSDSEQFNFSLAPKIGYAIDDNLILGLGLGYGYSKFESTPFSNQLNATNESTSNSFSFFPYVKKFFPVGKKLAFHAQGEVRFTFGNTSFENGDDIERDTDSNAIFIGFRPGFNYEITNNILIHANFGSLGYTRFKNEGENDFEQESESFRFDLGTSTLQFGFALVF